MSCERAAELKPLLLHYYVTYRCNARCQFCDIWRDRTLRGIPSPPIGAVKANLEQARRMGARFVDFTGGEPLLYEDLPMALEYAKRLGFWTSITTNGLLYPRQARSLKGLVDLLHVSLDSAIEEEHNWLRGVPCAHQVLRSLEIARSLGEKPDLLFTVTSQDVDAVEGMVHLAQRERLILIVNPEFRYFGNAGLSSNGIEALLRYAGEPYVYLNLAFVELHRRGGNDRRAPRCRVMDSTIVLSPDSALLVPCFHHRVRRFPVQGDLERVYYSDQVARWRCRQGRLPFCQGCTINCYFDPSFHYRMDRLLILSLISKAKYGIDKYLRPLFRVR